MIGFYNISVVLTYVGFGISIFGITQAIEGHPLMAIVCLMCSGICDMFDGKIARATKRDEDAKVFGIQIDSLSDLVCFGVFPAVIAYKLGVQGVWGIAVLVVYVLAALIRLAYFNVTEQKRQAATSEGRKVYQGLPVTTISALFPLFFIMELVFVGSFPIFLTICMLAVGVLFVLDIPIPKPHGKPALVLILFMFAYLISFIVLAARGVLK